MNGPAQFNYAEKATPNRSLPIRGRWRGGRFLGVVMLATAVINVVLPVLDSTAGAAISASGSPSNAPPTKNPSDPTVWLCFPGQALDPCAENLSYTTILPDGVHSIVSSRASKDPPVDCFYVYGTVSTQQTPNANLDIDPGETNVALLQAAPFSRECRVYAPIYRQATVSGMDHLYQGVNMAELYGDVVRAWTYYLAHYNHGRGVVLIGDSQGAYILESLIKHEVETHPGQLSKLVSAILTGGNVNVRSPHGVANGLTILGTLLQAGTPISGTTLGRVTPCRSSSQTRCVIAYSSFDETPPADALFGRVTTPGHKVLCTNPADLAAAAGKAEPLQPYYPRPDISLLGGVGAESFTTPWVTYPGRFSAACDYSNGASWLQINGATSPSVGSPYLTMTLGPLWGLHVDDINIAMGNLLEIVKHEAQSWLQHHSS